MVEEGVIVEKTLVTDDRECLFCATPFRQPESQRFFPGHTLQYRNALFEDLLLLFYRQLSEVLVAVPVQCDLVTCIGNPLEHLRIYFCEKARGKECCLDAEFLQQ